MKKNAAKKLNLKTAIVAQLTNASGAANITLTWTCYSVKPLGCDTDRQCAPTAPGGTIEPSDSCIDTSCLSC